MRCQVGTQHLAESNFGASGRGAVVVGEVEMAYTAFKSSKQHVAGGAEVVDIAEVMP